MTKPLFKDFSDLCERAKERISKFGRYTVSREMLLDLHRRYHDGTQGNSHYIEKYMDKLRSEGFCVKRLDKDWIRLTLED